MPYHQFVRHLGSVEYFDAKAFQAGSGVSKEVCNFVLALACVHGDIMDLFLAHKLLGEVKPDTRAKDTPWWGHWAGTMLHLLRIQAGVIHEFLYLIQKNKRKVLADSFFGKVLGSLPRNAREHWNAIVAAATDGHSRDPLARALKDLKDIRNRLAFHYDANKIGDAFRARFVKPEEAPALSKGPLLGATRFYFADHAADYFLLSTDRTREAKEALLDPKLMEGIAAVLSCIVIKFVETRGFNWKVEG